MRRNSQPVTVEVDKGDGIRPGIGNLVGKVAEGAAQAVTIEVARPNHIEARSLQRLGL